MRAPQHTSRVRWFIALVLVFGVLAGTIQPQPGIAATDLEIGGTAVIAEAQGDHVRLREEPGLHGDVIASFPEGTVVDVLDGPYESSDGSFWYLIETGGDTGYMISDYLFSESGGSSSGSATTTSDLNLRDGPSTSDGVILVMPPGANVSVNGSSSNGFYPVIYDGVDGWAHGSYLAFGDTSGDGSTGDATTTSDLNLRAGPSTADDVILVMPPDAAITLTGGLDNSFYSVMYQGIEGWAHSDYISIGSDGGSAPGDEAVVTSALNLRAGPSTVDDVLDVMPAGALLTVNGGVDNGFYPVTYSGTDGWAHGDYLDFDGSFEAPAAGSDIIWPVSGGEWEISQGYNGFSHYNGGGGYQYAYSLDLARTDGGAAWQNVYAPVGGTVRWTEMASGGITIDMGNGYAVALFHVTVDGSWEAGDQIDQGDYIGQLSGPGGDGYVSNFAHVHITVWETTDGGNWSRIAVPFTGSNAISGESFPSSGAYSEWAGTIVYP